MLDLYCGIGGMHHALLRALGQLGVGVTGHGEAHGGQREQGEERLREEAAGGSSAEGRSGDQAGAGAAAGASGEAAGGGVGCGGVELQVTAVDVNVVVGAGRRVGRRL